jgi:hypothetical protein
MTREIIEMARDSGMELYGLGKDRARFVHHLEAFAKLIAEKALAERAMSEVQRLGQEIEATDRTWVGLTEQEHTDIAVECGCMSADWVFYGAAVERKLKERNT